jgi:heme-degrading monooxygenase HmoA
MVPAFHDLARSTVPELRTRDGVVLANVARQIVADDGEDIIFATVWRDIAALYEWIGGSDLLEAPAPVAGFESYLTGRDLQYYEVIDTDAPTEQATDAGQRG